MLKCNVMQAKRNEIQCACMCVWYVCLQQCMHDWLWIKACMIVCKYVWAYAWVWATDLKMKACVWPFERACMWVRACVQYFVQRDRQRSKAGRKNAQPENIALVPTCLIIFSPSTTRSLQAELSFQHPDTYRRSAADSKKKDKTW